MKSFSEIRNRLKDYGYLGETHIPSQDSDKIEEMQEELGVGVQPHEAGDTPDYGNLLYLESEDSLNQLNAVVGSISHRNYMDPKVAVHNLRNKLQMIGLNFDLDESSIYSQESVSYPLYRFGIVSGFSKNLDGSYVNNLKTMGEQTLSSYVLEMNFEKLFNGLTSITANVKRV